MGMLDFLKVSKGIANNMNYSSSVLGTGMYSGHVGSSRKPDGRGVFINDLDIEYDGEWKDGKLCGFGRKYAKGYYDIGQGEGDEASKSLVYAGDFVDDRFHGNGKQYWQTGKLQYDGEWMYGWKCGEGTEFYENGKAKYVGSWSRSRYHGRGVFTYKNGDVIEGEWIEGLLEGEAFFKTREDNCVYKRNYKEGKVITEELISGTPKPSPDAKRVIEFDNGRYEGEVGFTGKMHGKGVFTYTNGNVYEGCFNEGVKQGKGVFRFADGDVYEGEYENDMRNGVGVYSYKNGNKYDGEWCDNVKSGHGVFYYSNGDRFEGRFEGSLKHGKGTFYFKNGDVFEGEWESDLRHGKGILTCADGVKKIQKWDRDKLVSESPIFQ